MNVLRAEPEPKQATSHAIVGEKQKHEDTPGQSVQVAVIILVSFTSTHMLNVFFHWEAVIDIWCSQAFKSLYEDALLEKR